MLRVWNMRLGVVVAAALTVAVERATHKIKKELFSGVFQLR